MIKSKIEIFSQQVAVSQKRCKIWPMLLTRASRT